MLRSVLILLLAMGMFATSSPSQAADMTQMRSDLQNAYELYESGSVDQSILIVKKLVDDAIIHYGPEHNAVSECYLALAFLLESENKLSQAELYYSRALQIKIKHFGLESTEAANSMTHLGAVLAKMGRVLEAEELLRKALSITEEMFGRDHVRVTVPLGGLAELLKSQARYGESADLFERTLKILREDMTLDNMEGILACLKHSGEIYQYLEDYESAYLAYREAIGIITSTYGHEHWELASLYNDLGLILTEKLDFEEADTSYRKSIKILLDYYEPTHSEVMTVMQNLNQLYIRLDQISDQSLVKK